MYTSTGADCHVDWISSVRLSPKHPMVASGSWDKTVKLWATEKPKRMATLRGQNGYVNTIAMSPDGSLCASGGKDGVAMLWNLGERRTLLELNAGSIIHALCFCPTRNWLCAATEKSVMVWYWMNNNLVNELFYWQHEAATPPASYSPPSDLAAYWPPPPAPPLRNGNAKVVPELQGVVVGGGHDNFVV
ncbi:hypothetical protein Ancab_034824 [Ancistrocladus abbreviatus]